jgi:CelD/BcsL family acetyltransferase involved in cellulose biosynthesis
VYRPNEILFVEVRRADRLVAIAPLQIYPKDGKRILAFMGGGVSDYLDVVVDPAVEDESLRAILDVVCREPAWDLMQLTDLPEHSPLFQHWPNGLPSHREVHDHSQVLDLPAGIGKLSCVIPAGKYKSLRNARSRLSRAGEFAIEVATRETLDECLAATFQLHESRWKETGFGGVLSESSVQAFHRLVAPQLIDRGILRLYILRLKGRIIAALHTLFEWDVAYLYIHGFDPAFRFQSPGAILFAAAIEDALGFGLHRIDFLRGREAYKMSWGCHELSTFCLRANRAVVPRTQRAA